MRIRHLVPVAALSLLTAGLWVGTQSTARADGIAAGAKTSDLLEAKPVTDPKTGMSLNVPKGWKVKENIEHTGYEAPAMDEDDTGSLAFNIVLTSAKTPGLEAKDLADVIKNAKETYAKQFDGYQEAKADKKVDVDNKTTEIMDYTILVQKTIKIQQRQYWVLSNGSIYIITFASLTSTFDKNKPLMEAIVKAITIP